MTKFSKKVKDAADTAGKALADNRSAVLGATAAAAAAGAAVRFGAGLQNETVNRAVAVAAAAGVVAYAASELAGAAVQRFGLFGKQDATPAVKVENNNDDVVPTPTSS